jgi:hypothetical protein
MDGWMNRYEWMDGRKDGWMDGWMDLGVYYPIHITKIAILISIISMGSVTHLTTSLPLKCVTSFMNAA